MSREIFEKTHGGKLQHKTQEEDDRVARKEEAEEGAEEEDEGETDKAQNYNEEPGGQEGSSLMCGSSNKVSSCKHQSLSCASL